MCVEIGGRHLVLASPELQPSVCSNWDVLKLVHTSTKVKLVLGNFSKSRFEPVSKYCPDRSKTTYKFENISIFKV